MKTTLAGAWGRCTALILSVLTMVGVAGLPLGYGESSPVILSRADARIWQTVFKPTEPLAWRWASKAVGARLVVTNALTCQVSVPAMVMRIEGDAYGTYALPDPVRSVETGEGLVDIVLEQVDASDAVVEVALARLAFLPGADGGNFLVEQPKASAWTMKGARVVSYDATWSEETKGAISARTMFIAAGSDPVERVLNGTSGHFAQKPCSGTLSLLFDERCFAETLLRSNGLMLFLR